MKDPVSETLAELRRVFVRTGTYDILLPCSRGENGSNDHIRCLQDTFFPEDLVVIASHSKTETVYVYLDHQQCVELATYLLEKAMHK